ncbi:30S ribosomal protein S8e [Candidatus Micrarchaeota archaeon]|nr:30S ribosomal protein S8e [Candidatus Micrarchaeota archaeon]
MVQYHASFKTKSSGTGAKKRVTRDKILANYGGFFAKPKLDKDAENEIREVKKGKGGTIKVKLKHSKFANVVLKDKTIKKVKIITVSESPANRHYASENVITKGAILETEAGKARVTSRPSQHGVVNAILL